MKGGNPLLLFIGVHTEEKNLLKRLTFSQKSEMKLPSTSKGGIAGYFYYSGNDLIWDNMFLKLY